PMAARRVRIPLVWMKRKVTPGMGARMLIEQPFRLVFRRPCRGLAVARLLHPGTALKREHVNAHEYLFNYSPALSNPPFSDADPARVVRSGAAMLVAPPGLLSQRPAPARLRGDLRCSCAARALHADPATARFPAPRRMQ